MNKLRKEKYEPCTNKTETTKITNGTPPMINNLQTDERKLNI